MIVSLDPTISKTRHVLYPNPPIWTVFSCMLRHTLTYSLPSSFFTTIALATGSSASFSALPPRNNGYISTAIKANTKNYDHIKGKFVKGTGIACAFAAMSRAGSFGGYTISPSKRLRPFILPTQVHEEVLEKDVFSYVGTTSNVPTQSAIVRRSRDDFIGSARDNHFRHRVKLERPPLPHEFQNTSRFLPKPVRLGR